VTCSAPLQSDWWCIPEFTQCSRCKRNETEQKNRIHSPHVDYVNVVFTESRLPAKTPTSMGPVRPSRNCRKPTSVLWRRTDVLQTSVRSLKSLMHAVGLGVENRRIHDGRTTPHWTSDDDVPNRRRADVNESSLLTKSTLARCVSWRHFCSCLNRG